VRQGPTARLRFSISREPAARCGRGGLVFFPELALQEADQIVSSLPLWPLSHTRVTPLIAFGDRRNHVRPCWIACNPPRPRHSRAEPDTATKADYNASISKIFCNIFKMKVFLNSSPLRAMACESGPAPINVMFPRLSVWKATNGELSGNLNSISPAKLAFSLFCLMISSTRPVHLFKCGNPLIIKFRQAPDSPPTTTLAVLL